MGGILFSSMYSTTGSMTAGVYVISEQFTLPQICCIYVDGTKAAMGMIFWYGTIIFCNFLGKDLGYVLLFLKDSFRWMKMITCL